MRKKESDPFFFLPLFLFNAVHLLRPLAGPTGPFFFLLRCGIVKTFSATSTTYSSRPLTPKLGHYQTQTLVLRFLSVSLLSSRWLLFTLFRAFVLPPTTRRFFFFIRDSHVGNREIIGWLVRGWLLKVAPPYGSVGNRLLGCINGELILSRDWKDGRIDVLKK